MSLWTLTFNAKGYSSQTVVMPKNVWGMAKQAELQQLQASCSGRTSAKARHTWERFALSLPVEMLIQILTA